MFSHLLNFENKFLYFYSESDNKGQDTQIARGNKKYKPTLQRNIYVFVYIKTLAFGSHFFDACFSGIPLASNPCYFGVQDILMSIIV